MSKKIDYFEEGTPRLNKVSKTKDRNKHESARSHYACHNVQLNVDTKSIQSAAPWTYVQDWSRDNAAQGLWLIASSDWTVTQQTPAHLTKHSHSSQECGRAWAIGVPVPSQQWSFLCQGTERHNRTHTGCNGYDPRWEDLPSDCRRKQLTLPCLMSASHKAQHVWSIKTDGECVSSTCLCWVEAETWKFRMQRSCTLKDSGLHFSFFWFGSLSPRQLHLPRGYCRKQQLGHWC